MRWGAGGRRWAATCRDGAGVKRMLAISPDLSLPLDAVTQTLIVYGGKGMGKTTFGNVLVEELAKAGRRFSVLDPLGVWWGLAYAADGKGPGIEFIGLGGPKGDIPITPASGSVVADFVADEEVSTVISLLHADGRMWSVGERIKFVADYTYRLFERQGERKVPLMQIIDEAGRFVPQVIPAQSVDLARCVGGIEQLTEWGRNVAVGVTLITQRSARMNKSVSELADMMVAFRTVGPRSIDAILDWFGEHVAKDRWRELIEQLRALPVGRALVVSPGWLGFEGSVQIRPRETFDSSATPDGSGARRPSGRGAKPDLDKYRVRMLATSAEAEANDPRKLRARIAVLERELTAKPRMVASEPVIERVEIPTPMIEPETLATIAAAMDRIEEAARSIHEGANLLSAMAIDVRGGLAAVRGQIATPPALHPVRRATRPPEPPRPSQEPAPAPAVRTDDVAGNGSLGRAERLILSALAQYPAGMSRRQLSLATGYPVAGSSLRNSLATLRGLGYVERSGEPIKATSAGLGVIEVEPLPKPGPALVGWWMERLGKAEREILTAMVNAYPEEVRKTQLAELTGYPENGSSLRNALATLRGRQLVEGFRATHELMG